MIPVTDHEAAVLSVIRRWQRNWRNSPNTPELCDECELTDREVQTALHGLTFKGYVELTWTKSHRQMIVPLYWE